MNKLLLKLVMLLSGVWKSMGADIEQLRAILDVRLKMDDRKPLPMRRTQKQKKPSKNTSLLGAFFSVIMGCVYMLPILVIQDTVFGLTIYFTLVLLLLVITLISDFSNALFDTRDKYILLPKPVNDQTVLLSRTLYIFIYLFRAIIPLSLPGWIVLGIMHGWAAAALFIVPLLLLVFMALFFVIGTYMLLLKLAKPSKFKEIINYFQIVFSVIFFASAYLLPRLFASESLMLINMKQHPGIRFLPPYWLAACWTWLGFPSIIPNAIWFSILAVVFPIVSLWIVLKWLAPKFISAIAAIDGVDVAELKVAKTGQQKTKSGVWYKWLANVFNRNSDAKAGFMITWLQTARSRNFKMRVYPIFAYVPVYFVYLLTMSKRSFRESWEHLPQSSSYLILLYLCTGVITQALTYLAMSEQYKASWIYYASPLETPGRVMMGAFKAIWVKYLLPFYFVISIFIISVWGMARIPDVILALSNVTFLALVVMRISFRYLPFSIAEQMNQGGSRIIKVLVFMMVPAALGFGHYLAIDILWLKLLFLVLSGILLWLAWDSCYNTTWATLRNTELES